MDTIFIPDPIEGWLTSGALHMNPYTHRWFNGTASHPYLFNCIYQNLFVF